MLTLLFQNFFVRSNANKIITKKNLFLLSVVFLFSISITINSADGAIFMKYGDIIGDVQVSGFEDQIACDSFSFSVSRSIGAASSGSSRDRSDPSFSDITCTKSLDLSSAKLFGQAAFGVTTPEVVISFVESGSKSESLVFLEYKLTNVLVSSYSTQGNADDRPSETITMNFEKLETIFTPFDSKSKPGSTLTECWNLVKNTNCKTISKPPPPPPPPPEGQEDSDNDNDGIALSIDTNPDEFSNDFNDGKTFGRILTRGEQTLKISDLPNPEGVQVEVIGPAGSIGAVVEACGGLSTAIFDTVGQTGIFDCGSVFWSIISGTVFVTFTDEDGFTSTSTLVPNDKINFDEGTYEITAISGIVEIEL